MNKDTLFDDPNEVVSEDAPRKKTSAGKIGPSEDSHIDDAIELTPKQKIAKLKASIQIAQTMSKNKSFPEAVRERFASKIAIYKKELENLQTE